VPGLRLSIMARVLDALVPDLPFVGRREFAEMQAFEVEFSEETPIPTQQIEEHQAMVLQVDVASVVDMGTIALGPGGIIVVYNGVPTVSPPTVAPDEGTVTVRGVVFGGPEDDE
jgi:hypothetical protein